MDVVGVCCNRQIRIRSQEVSVRPPSRSLHADGTRQLFCQKLLQHPHAVVDQFRVVQFFKLLDSPSADEAFEEVGEPVDSDKRVEIDQPLSVCGFYGVQVRVRPQKVVSDPFADIRRPKRFFEFEKDFSERSKADAFDGLDFIGRQFGKEQSFVSFFQNAQRGREDHVIG